MKVLADANVPATLVRWLESEGHDVCWALRLAPGVPDDELLVLARTERRVVVTLDLDFGELVFRQGRASAGVLLLRYRAARPHDLVTRFAAHWPSIAERLEGAFVVVTNTRMRVRRLPEGGA